MLVALFSFFTFLWRRFESLRDASNAEIEFFSVVLGDVGENVRWGLCEISVEEVAVSAGISVAEGNSHVYMYLPVSSEDEGDVVTVTVLNTTSPSLFTRLHL